MKLRALGRQGEFCNDAGVPVITGKEKVIGFRQLEYAIHRRGLLKKEVLPKTAGWVYQTDRRILLLDDGWVDEGGAPHKRYHEVAFEETEGVRHKIAKHVLVDFTSAATPYAIAFTPYGPSARLFDWLLKARLNIEKYRAGELESPYAKDKWYRHPPK